MIDRLTSLIPLIALALLLLQGPGHAKEQRVALVIGNSAYRSAPMLANPVRDAQAVADMFRTAGFDTVELKLNLDSLEMKRAVRNFLLTARDSDLAVVYFAGHGIEVSGVNYVVPIDAKLRTDLDVEDEGIALDRLIRAVEPARRLRIVILDACRDNPFLNTIQRTVSVRAITAGLAKVEPEASDTLVAYAARAGSVAEDGKAEHSPFTSALLQHLPTPGLDIRVAFGRVRDDVMRATGGKQEPFVYGSLGGSTISIVPERPGAVVPNASPSDPVAEARRNYELAERVGTRDSWTSFLKAHPTGFFADLARAQLTKFPNATNDVARIDVSKPDVRRPPATATAAIAVQPLGHDQRPDDAAIGSPPANRPSCGRDREVLAKLREDPVAAKVAQFAKELTCDELRPQLVRLMESIGIGDADKDGRSAQPASKPPAGAGPPTILSPTPRRESVPALADCERETQILARLRSAPDLQSVDRFAHELSCRELMPQVLRLRESL